MPNDSRAQQFSRLALSRVSRSLRQFLQAETAGGIVLAAATLAALVWANSQWSAGYDEVWETELSLRLGNWELAQDLRHWVNDALMTIFFLVVGLEIKRELVAGELRDKRAAAMPALAAVGGMVVPAIIYLAFNPSGTAARGWGIPMATDIAFSLGVLGLLGSRISSSLKLFLLTLAIADDIGAILVIALFYSGGITLIPLLLAFVLIGVVVALRASGVWWTPAYTAVGALLWLATFESGLHPTLAGVTLGLLTPAAQGRRGRTRRGSIAEHLERTLHPWASFLVIPVFALANAGVSLSPALLGRAVTSPIALGVALGLVVGKTFGIFLFSWMAYRLRLGKLPARASWRQMAGIGSITGIGFTVSLFVATLAFELPLHQEQAKVGILLGSLVSALLGSAILWTRGEGS